MKPPEILALRQKLHLTQLKMAERLGVHLRTYQQWEYGRRTPSAATRKLLEQLQQEVKK